MRKMKLISFLLTLCLLLTACTQTGAPAESTRQQAGILEEGAITLSNVTPAPNETVSLLGDYAEAFLEDYYFGIGLDTAAKNNEIYLKTGPTYRYVTFSWECDIESTGYTLTYSMDPDLSDARTLETNTQTVRVPGLYVNTTYYWQVTVNTADGAEYSPVYTFQTADTPRTFYLDGVVNTRDLGGYLTEDGKHRVVQGMIYRGANLDGITGEGMKQATEIFGVKTDLDLRSSGSDNMLYTDKSPILMGQVQYINIPGVSYSSCLPISVTMRNELEVFTNPDNYPIYFHCAAGRDRAGTLAFLLNALLGVPEEKLLADYELTYLSSMAYAAGDMRGHNNMVNFLYNFQMLEGETTQEKAQTYWKNIGLTQQQLDTFYSIMLEDA